MEQPSKIPLWIGRGLTALLAALLLFSASMKLQNSPDIQKEMVGKFGYPVEVTPPIGVVELVCMILFVIPRTSVLGAILLTGYLGGATATHVRVNDPWFGPVIIGVVVWVTLLLREPRLRALLPIRRKAT